MSIIITPECDTGRHYDVICYNGNDKGDVGLTIEVSNEEFDTLLTAKDYDELALQSKRRMHMIKDYIEQYPDCIGSNHPYYAEQEVA